MKNKIVAFIVLGYFTVWAENTSGQKPTLPFTLNAAGAYGVVNGQMFDFSLGEMLLVHTFEAKPYALTQGFLQPYILAIPPPINVVIENNVITPNNDGKNDVFVVKGLELYPGSVLRIVDRAGRLLYQVSDYKNDWNGYYNGVPLYEDTYYYIIDLGKGRALVRGFISIIRDER